MSASATVELSQIAVRRHGSLILHELDLTVAAGEIVGIRGPNGSGKTTLLRVIATLLRPTAGRARVLGADPGDQRAAAGVRPRISMVGHIPALWPELTLRENIAVLPNLRHEGGDAIDAVLAGVGLTAAADRRADRSSLGMQRRIEFARIRLARPDLLLLDEAHAGLDAVAAGLVDDTARAVKEAGGSVVVVSHEPGRVSAMLTRTLDLVDGRLVDGR